MVAVAIATAVETTPCSLVYNTPFRVRFYVLNLLLPTYFFNIHKFHFTINYYIVKLLN
jgi:hypothetical protein